jgi:hypothetical protein
MDSTDRKDVWRSLALSSALFTARMNLSADPGTNFAEEKPRSGVMVYKPAVQSARERGVGVGCTNARSCGAET